MNTKYISKFLTGSFLTGTIFLCLCGFFAASINAQIRVGGNPTCADLNADNANFPTISSNNGFSTDDAPKSGVSNYNITNVGTVTVNYNSDTNIGFSATSAFVTAVIVKAADGANVYIYNPAAANGGPLETYVKNGKNAELSHLVFCYAPSLAPTAATAMIAGRVTTDTGFVRGSGRLLVTVLNTTTLETQSVFTNRLGYYELNDLPVGATYIVNVQGKGYNFTPQTFTLSEDSALDLFGFSFGRSGSSGNNKPQSKNF